MIAQMDFVLNERHFRCFCIKVDMDASSSVLFDGFRSTAGLFWNDKMGFLRSGPLDELGDGDWRVGRSCDTVGCVVSSTMWIG